MRWLLAATILLGSTMTAHAATYVYVSMGPEQKIALYQVAGEGTLEAVDTFDVGASPGSLNFDPQKKFLFASLRSTSSLASFQVDPKTGRLKHLSTVPLGKDQNAAFVRTDLTGRWLLSASYSGGKVVVHRIGEDGKIESPAVQTIDGSSSRTSLPTPSTSSSLTRRLAS